MSSSIINSNKTIYLSNLIRKGLESVCYLCHEMLINVFVFLNILSDNNKY